LDSGQALGGKVYTELGKINKDQQSGALATNVDEHIKTLHEIKPLGLAYYKSLEQAIDKWKYYGDQTDYIFGDNPYNLGPNAVLNATEGFADFLSDWSRAANRKEILPLVSSGATEANEYMKRYSQWLQGSRQRLLQVKQSIQPNGVVQPLPLPTPAPATGMFTMKIPQPLARETPGPSFGALR
jgi:hypothetical protein